MYHVSVRTGIRGNGGSTDSSGQDYFDPSQSVPLYAKDIAYDQNGNYISIFKKDPIGQQPDGEFFDNDNCGYTNFAMSDGWSFSLDSACDDASIVRQETSGDVFIQVNSATANTTPASACTLTAKGKGMNPAKYRLDGSLVEDQALSQTAMFTTVAKDRADLPKVEKIKLDGRELPLGELVLINTSELTRNKVGDPVVDGIAVSDYCGGTNYPETRCTPITLEGKNITTAHWRISKGADGTNRKVFWSTIETAADDGIVLLATIENSSNILVQKKVFFYLDE